jgi:phosphate transport system substrate-binding protein
VDFGATDKPLTAEELAEGWPGAVPAVIGGVVPVVNLAGIEPGQLRLTGPLLADIYLGKVTQWNDPAIAALNPGLALPDRQISVVHRSDGSGTTFNFDNYLSKVSPEWQSTVGEGTAVSWPTGVGGKGNEGVAAYVQADRRRHRLRGAAPTPPRPACPMPRCRTRPATACARAPRLSRRLPRPPTGPIRRTSA